MKFRELNSYKYKLTEDYSVKTELIPPKDIYYPEEKPFIVLTKKGILTLKEGFCWDGASGPTWDDETNIIPSAVHDALYQLDRIKVFEYSIRLYADQFFEKLLEKNGMNPIRRKIYYYGLRAFGWYATLFDDSKKDRIKEIK